MKKLNSFAACAVLALMALPLTMPAAHAADVEVYFVGDSMMKSVGRVMKKKLKAKDVSADYFASIGSGLARLDLFDWNSKVDEILAEKPQRVVIFIGANDNQPMKSGAATVKCGSDAWGQVYGKRAGGVMDQLIKGGVKEVTWIGLPCMRDGALDADTQVINEVVKKEADTRAEVTFFPTREMFSKKGAYSAYIIQSSGVPLDVRESDGVHLNRSGAEYLADQLTAQLTN